MSWSGRCGFGISFRVQCGEEGSSSYFQFSVFSFQFSVFSFQFAFYQELKTEN